MFVTLFFLLHCCVCDFACDVMTNKMFLFSGTSSGVFVRVLAWLLDVSMMLLCQQLMEKHLSMSKQLMNGMPR